MQRRDALRNIPIKDFWTDDEGEQDEGAGGTEEEVRFNGTGTGTGTRTSVAGGTPEEAIQNAEEGSTPSVADALTLVTSTGTTAQYNKGEVARAKATRAVCTVMNHPGSHALESLLDAHDINPKLHLTGTDARNATDMFGACLGCLKGKSKFYNRLQLKTPNTTRIGEIVHCDYFFLPGPGKTVVAWLMAVDNYSGFFSCHTRLKKGKEFTQQNFLALIHAYSAAGHTVSEIRTDHENVFLTCKDFFISQGVHHTPTTPYRHEPIAEKAIDTLKSHFRATLTTLPYELPTRLYHRLVLDCITTLNITPTSKTIGTASPRELFTGLRVNYQLAVREAFGALVNVHNPRPERTTTEPRVEQGLVVGRDITTGSLTIWLIPTKQYVVRDLPTPTPLTAVTKAWINAEATKDASSFGRIPPLTSLQQRKKLQEGVLSEQEREPDEGEELDQDDTPVETVPPSQDIVNDQELTDQFDLPSDSLPLPLPLPSTLSDTAVGTVTPSTSPETLALRRSGRNIHIYDGLTGTVYYSYMGTHKSVIVEIFDEHGLAASNMTMKQASAKNPEGTNIGVQKEVMSMINKAVLQFTKLQDLTEEEIARAIPSKMFLKEKDDGIVKARVVARGDRQDKMSTEETNAPTVMTVTLMGLLQIITTDNLDLCVADVETAYLNADNTSNDIMYISEAEAQHFVRAQPHLAEFLDIKGRLYCRVKKALYGMQQSAKLWYDHLKATLVSIGYQPLHEDRCAFVKIVDKKKCVVLIYVDDLFIANSNKREMSRVKAALESAYPRMKFNEADSFTYLGLDIKREGANRSTTLVTQRKYMEDMLKDYNISKKKAYPAGLTLLKQAEDRPIDVTQFLSLLMKLMYLAKRTRPDILLACSFLSTHCQAPMREHWLQLIHILEYLNGTQGLGLKFTRQNFRMTCQADASYLTHNDVKSHSGITYSLAEGGPSISCFSLKQKITAQSSTEAELIALHEGARSTVWISSLMKQLGANFPTPLFIRTKKPQLD